MVVSSCIFLRVEYNERRDIYNNRLFGVKDFIIFEAGISQALLPIFCSVVILSLRPGRIRSWSTSLFIFVVDAVSCRCDFFPIFQKEPDSPDLSSR